MPFSSTNIDDYLLDENSVRAISGRMPSTAWGRELMTTGWPRMYTSGLTSETYLGCVAALSALCANVYSGISLWQIQQQIIAIDESLKRSRYFLPNSDRGGGAVLTVTNAWQRTSALSAEQVVASFDSELIYAARLYVTSRQRELAGERLS